MAGNGKLRQWLIEQVDGGQYPGLVWEDRDKSTFRIPWKHAGKQDYNRDEDAALFKAWALFKGKYRDGIDKPDPPTWKTRLRCALNKSNDFEELVDKSQLDTSEPYKVYRVIPEGSKRVTKPYESSSVSTSHQNYPLYPPLQSQVSNFLSHAEKGCKNLPEQTPVSEIYYPYTQNPYTPYWETGFQMNSSFYGCNTVDSSPSHFPIEQIMRSVEALALSDPRIQVTVYSGESLIRDVTVFSVDGCRLTSYVENQAHGGPELIPIPHCEGTEFEQGILLWMAPDGLCARRLCNARVYWKGGPIIHTDHPNKLEKDQITKLLDIQLFITELQSCYLQSRPIPRFQVLLYIEQEFNTNFTKKTITVQVEPLFGRQLFHLSQQYSTYPYHMRSHDHAPPMWEQMSQNHHTAISYQQNTLQD